VAVLRLADKEHKVILPAENDTRSTAEMLQSDDFKVLRQVLADFKRACIENQIVPVMLYFPSADHVYADYVTQMSGQRALRRRDQHLPVRGSMEAAVRTITQQLGMEFVSLTPALERAAGEGKLVYYPTDSHWNSEGKEVAARYVADVLEKKQAAK
jgi:hypothetical protein